MLLIQQRQPVMCETCCEFFIFQRNNVSAHLVVAACNPRRLICLLITDRFEFRPSGSTHCALMHMLHHVTAMLENCDYVRCLMIDFTRAFDVVDHPVLLGKLSQLDLPECILNWIVSSCWPQSVC